MEMKSSAKASWSASPKVECEMWPGISAISHAVTSPAVLLWTRLARAARGRTMSAPKIAGNAVTLHQTASSAGISSSQDRLKPPKANDHENRGGRGLIAPIG